MFGFVADFLTSVTSILFPVYASYKALRTSDPANLAPWLMYWTTLSLLLAVESQFHFILSWVPFYSWLRLGVHLYLVLPGQQGSVFIYKEYIHPFLDEHERQIDRLISDAHAKAKAAGMDAVRNAVEYIRVQILGGAPRRPSPPPSRNVSYSTQLLNRFVMPSARDGLSAAGTSDILGLIGRALQQTSAAAPNASSARATDLSSAGLIPPNLSGAERSDFISTQNERLRSLLRAFEAEAQGPIDRDLDYDAHPSSARPAYLRTSSGAMHKSRSESEFEDLGYEAMPDPEHYRSGPGADDVTPQRTPLPESGGAWSNWVWGSYGEKDSAINRERARKDL